MEKSYKFSKKRYYGGIIPYLEENFLNRIMLEEGQFYERSQKGFFGILGIKENIEIEDNPTSIRIIINTKKNKSINNLKKLVKSEELK